MKRKYKLEGIQLAMVLRKLIQTRSISSLNTYFQRYPELSQLCSEASTDRKDSRQDFLQFVEACIVNTEANVAFANGKTTSLRMACGLLEGKGKVYNTGSRASEATKRRVRAMEIITGVEVQHRNRPSGKRSLDSSSLSLHNSTIQLPSIGTEAQQLLLIKDASADPAEAILNADELDTILLFELLVEQSNDIEHVFENDATIIAGASH